MSLIAFQHLETGFNSDKNHEQELIGEQDEEVHLDESAEKPSEPNESETDSIDDENSIVNGKTATASNPNELDRELTYEMSEDVLINLSRDDPNEMDITVDGYIVENPGEDMEEMSVEDIIKFYEDERNIYTSENIDEKYCGIIPANVDETRDVTKVDKKLKTKPIGNPEGLKKSTRKKSVNQQS